mgnify:CR=1 FL=1
MSNGAKDESNLVPNAFDESDTWPLIVYVKHTNNVIIVIFMVFYFLSFYIKTTISKMDYFAIIVL